MSYFRPLRRTLGVVTLLVTCMFTAGWMRSLSTIDMVALPTKVLNYTLLSGEHAFGATGNFIYNFRQVERVEHGQTIVRVEITQVLPQASRAEVAWWKFKGSEFRLFRSNSELDGVVPMIPYWMIVIPLTLLSAWLLLSNPRTPKPAREAA